MAHEIVLECRGIHHGFGQKRVLHDVNLKIIRGEIVALVGPSGCGKSTLLRAIVGTHPPQRGAILVTGAGQTTGRVVCKPGRDRGIVYQQYALFPFLTARENVAMGLMLDETSIFFRLFRYPAWRQLRKQHLEAAAELLDRLMLGEAGRLYPQEMSGGMRQRVAIAQALITRPEILLLDEPFGALDEATREELQRMLLTLYRENCLARERREPPPYTVLIVTHELNEALYVGDRIAGLSQYWNWKEAGHPEPVGATIVYDRIAPVYLPDDVKDLQALVEQRTAVRLAAFEPEVLEAPEKQIRFWEEIKEGKGRGVLK